MQDAERARWRERLDLELAKTNDALVQAKRAAGVVELDQSSVGRVSRIDALQQQALATANLERLRTQLRKLDAAITRLDGGRFGTCCACAEDIDLQRLQADPAAPFCSDCAAERAR